MLSTEYKTYYKNLSKTSNFITLVINKTIYIINDKLANYVSVFTDKIIKDDNVKKYSNWNDIVNNYTNFLTIANNLIGFDHTINYLRKMIFAQSNKIDKKITKLIDNSHRFIESVKAIIISLDYFAKTLDIVTPVSKEIKSLNDLTPLIKQSIDIFENKHLVKIEQSSASLSKTGSSEIDLINQDLTNYMISGGFDNNPYYQINRTGGNDTQIIISGFHAEEHVKQQFIKYKLLNNDQPTQLDNSYTALTKLSIDQLISHFLTTSGILDNLYQQFMIFGTIQCNLLKYHTTRFTIEHTLLIQNTENSISINYRDKSNNINLNTVWDADIPKSVNHLMYNLELILALINKADYDKILKELISSFKSINQTDDISKCIIDLQSDFQIVSDPDFSYNARKIGKDQINQKIQMIKSLINTKITIPKIILGKTPTDELGCMEQIINIEQLLIPTLKEYEILYDNCASELFNLIAEINSLISPDNKFTCIKRPLLLFNTALKLSILQKLSEKRPNEAHDKVIYKKMHIVLDKLLGFNIDNFYDDELNLEFIKQIISRF